MRSPGSPGPAHGRQEAFLRSGGGGCPRAGSAGDAAPDPVNPHHASAARRGAADRYAAPAQPGVHPGAATGAAGPVTDLPRLPDRASDGDLTQRVDSRRDDEAGQLADAFNRFVE